MYDLSALPNKVTYSNWRTGMVFNGAIKKNDLTSIILLILFPLARWATIEMLPCLTRHTLAQLRTYKSPFIKSYLHKVNNKSHPSPLCPLCNTYTHDTHHLLVLLLSTHIISSTASTYAPHCHLWICGETPPE